MAALLYLGEYVHARHLWRRWKQYNPPTLLVDWWRVGRAMMECDASTLWEGLAYIWKNHPAPLNSYAKSVGDAFRIKLLMSTNGIKSTEQIQQLPAWTLLNFSSPQEVESFCQEHEGSLARPSSNININLDRSWNASTLTENNNKASLIQVVSFLEANPTWNL